MRLGAPHFLTISAVVAALCLLFPVAESLPAAGEEGVLEKLAGNRPRINHEAPDHWLHNLKDASLEELQPGSGPLARGSVQRVV